MVSLHPELMWVYSLGLVKVGPVHLAYDIEISEAFQGDKRLTFKMLSNDPKLEWLGADQHIVYRDEAWRLSKKAAVRNNSERSVEWEAEPLWYDLADFVWHRFLIVTAQTVVDGLNLILSGTNWTAGSFDYNPDDLHSYEGEAPTALEALRAWAVITQKEIYFDTVNRQVFLHDQVGEDRGIGFRYRKNLDEVKQTFLPPKVTRLYPEGVEGIGIENVNAGSSYIENFDWYISQGLTEEQARILFTKAAVWRDETYLTALSLYDAAQLRLEDWSQPTISYECTVMDLSELTGLPEDEFNVGDYVRVADETLGIDIRVRVVKLVKHPYQPWENEIELNYLQPGFTTELLNSISTGGGGGSNWRLLIDESINRTITSSGTSVCALYMSTTENASAVIGAHLVGVATGTGTLRTSLILNGNALGGEVLTPFTSGQNIDVGIPSWMSGLIEDSHSLLLRAEVVSGAGTVEIEEFEGRLYALVNGLRSGGSSGSSTLINIADTLVDSTEMPTDNVTPIFQTDLTEGLSDTLTDDTVMPVDSPPTITFA